jgi:hypothetical protein
MGSTPIVCNDRFKKKIMNIDDLDIINIKGIILAYIFFSFLKIILVVNMTSYLITFYDVYFMSIVIRLIKEYWYQNSYY